MMRNDKLLDSWIVINALLPLVVIPSVAVGIQGKESFLGWPVVTKPFYAMYTGIIATGGILELAETLGTQMAITLLCCWYLFKTRKSPVYLACGALAVMALAVSQSRGAFAAVYVSLGSVWLARYLRAGPRWRWGIVIVLLVVPYVMLDAISRVTVLAEWLRLDLGMSGREGAWYFALDLISARPWTGYGFNAASVLTDTYEFALRALKFRAAGAAFHNSFITKAVDVGVPTALIYLGVFFAPVSALGSVPVTERTILLERLVIVFLVSAMFKDLNIGGVRSISFAGSVFWGAAQAFHLRHGSRHAGVNDGPDVPKGRKERVSPRGRFRRVA